MDSAWAVLGVPLNQAAPRIDPSEGYPKPACTGTLPLALGEATLANISPSTMALSSTLPMLWKQMSQAATQHFWGPVLP